MKKITVSAPGKLVLFGEHAVVYGKPCIVTAVGQRMHVSIELLENKEFQLTAPDVKINNYKKPMLEIGLGDIPKEVLFVETAVKNTIKSKKAGLKITTKSEFSSQLGFGSSSAVTVCVIKALSELFNLQLSKKQIFDVAYKTVLGIQKKGSGFDIAAAIFGGTLYFVKAGKKIESLSVGQMPLIIGYSGIKADTVILMNKVKEKFKNNKYSLNKIFNEIEIIVDNAKQALSTKDFLILGKLMNKNQMLLEKLGVSIPKLDTMIVASLQAGAYGAKLSGAGGGDCMIAISSIKNKKAVENAILALDGEIINTQINAEGIRVE